MSPQNRKFGSLEGRAPARLLSTSGGLRSNSTDFSVELVVFLQNLKSHKILPGAEAGWEQSRVETN